MTKKLARLLVLFLVIPFSQLSVAESKPKELNQTSSSKPNQFLSSKIKDNKTLIISIDEKYLNNKTGIIVDIKLPRSIKKLPNTTKNLRPKVNNLESKKYNSRNNNLKSRGVNKQAKLKETGISLYRPRIDTYYRQGNNQRSLGRIDIFLPLLQNKSNILFFNLMSTKDNISSKEGNFGLGHRMLFNDKFILGYYGFYDYKISSDKNVMQQATFGGELLTRNFDLRANLYVPKEKAQRTHYTSNGEAIIVKNNSLYASSGSYEAAMMGADFEIGLRIPYPIIDKFKLSTGYAHFQSKSLDDSLDRFNSRIEYSLFTNDNHSIILDGEYIYQTNKNRNPSIGYQFGKNVYYGGLRYSYLFGQKQIGLNSLQARMNSRIIRDIDIVTTNKMQNADIKIADIYSVGNGNNGEKYKTLTEAYDAILKDNPANPIILISSGNYSSNGLVINKDNLRVSGLSSHANFKVGSTSKDICLLVKCNLDRPIIDVSSSDSSSAVSNNSLTVSNSNNIEIAGLEFKGSRDLENINKSIIVNGVNNFYIHNNKFNGGSTAVEVNHDNNQTLKMLIINNEISPSSTSSVALNIKFRGNAQENLIEVTGNTFNPMGNNSQISITNNEFGSWGKLNVNISDNNFNLTENGLEPNLDKSIMRYGNIMIGNSNYSKSDQVVINFYRNTIRSKEYYDPTLQELHNSPKQNSILGIIDENQGKNKALNYYTMNGLKTNKIYYNDGNTKLDISAINNDNINHYYRTSFVPSNLDLETLSYETNPDINNPFYLYNQVRLNAE